MYKFFSKRIVKYLNKEKLINDIDLDLYEYCFELLVSTVISILSIALLSLALGEFLSSMAFLCSFILTRFCCGGYHAKSHLTCFLTTLTNYFFFIVTLIFITKYSYKPILISNLFSLVLLAFFAPSENEHNPLSQAEKRMHKYKSVFVALCISVIGLVGANTHYEVLFKIICSTSIGLFSATLSMICGQIEKYLKSRKNK